MTMSTEKIEAYLEQANSLKEQSLATVLAVEGTVNNIDYHMEMMQKEYPDKEVPMTAPTDKPYVVELGPKVNDE